MDQVKLLDFPLLDQVILIVLVIHNERMRVSFISAMVYKEHLSRLFRKAFQHYLLVC